jgi:hypothetical protein
MKFLSQIAGSVSRLACSLAERCKTLSLAAAVAAAVVVSTPAPARAESPRSVAAALTAGAATITNNTEFTTRELKKLTITLAQGSSWTATIKNVGAPMIVGSTNRLTWTNVVCAITSTAAQASTTLTLTNWQFYASKLICEGAGTNTGYFIPEWIDKP